MLGKRSLGNWVDWAPDRDQWKALVKCCIEYPGSIGQVVMFLRNEAHRHTCLKLSSIPQEMKMDFILL